MKSIQSRLISGLLISLLLVFAILWFAVSHNIQRLSENTISTRLEHDIETLLTAISFDNKDKLVLDEKYINAIYQRPFSGHYYQIQHKGSLVRSRSLWDQELVAHQEKKTNIVKSKQPGPDKQSLLSLTARYTKQQQSFVITIAEDLTPIRNDINQFKMYFSVIAVLILGSLLFIQFIILRNGLKPLRQLQTELKELENGKIQQLTTEVPAELDAVVSEVNHLSLALYQRLKRSRAALSDLSHAIKKPLTLLQNFSDENADKLDKQDSDYLDKQVNAIQHLTDRILKQARIAGSSRHSTLYTINDDVSILLKTITAMYPDKSIDIKLNMSDNFKIQVDREDMLELLGNLLDNAWKWASKTVALSFNNDNGVRITIEDDGPGAEADKLNELSQRGVRLDESVEGYGFGLAIAADIIKDHNGTMTFSQSEKLGGFKIEIQLPENKGAEKEIS